MEEREDRPRRAACWWWWWWCCCCWGRWSTVLEWRSTLSLTTLALTLLLPDGSGDARALAAGCSGRGVLATPPPALSEGGAGEAGVCPDKGRAFPASSSAALLLLLSRACGASHSAGDDDAPLSRGTASSSPPLFVTGESGAVDARESDCDDDDGEMAMPDGWKTMPSA